MVRLTLSEVQHDKESRRAIRSFSFDQLDALAKHARLLGTVVRDDKMAEGCMLYFNELVKVHNAAKKERTQNEKKAAEKAKQSEKAAKRSWNDSLVAEPKR